MMPHFGINARLSAATNSVNAMSPSG
jgi:hypothetical protein